jgi:hypothetical protein
MIQNISQTTIFNSSLSRGQFIFTLQAEQVENPDGTVSINAMLSQLFHRYTTNILDGTICLEHAELSTEGLLVIGKKSNLSRGNTSVSYSFSSPRREYIRVVKSIGFSIVSDYEVDRSVGAVGDVVRFQGDSP